jgi:hypothetical protein
MNSNESENTPAANLSDGDVDSLLSIRAILLAEEHKRLGILEHQLESARRQARADNEDLQQQVKDLLVEQERLRQLLQESKDRAYALETEMGILRRKAQGDSDGLIARVTPVLGDMIGRTIRDSREEMAEALGPVMGEAIRVQIRNSRKDMIEALYPVIGETVQRAIAEFTREFQRNIDVRLRSTFGPQGFMRSVFARLRGVSASELAMRDALPFTIREIFLIQHGSGLLLAHSHPGSAEVADADLIGGMLTAIRDFAHDAFGQGLEEKDLDEIQYGDQHIIIQSGRIAYLAVVINGVEPEGFHAKLREFISELHVKYENALRQYSGDPATLPNLDTKIARLAAETTGEGGIKLPMTGKRRLAWAGLWLGLLLLLSVACFYLQFTVALYPVAFPSSTATNTSTPTRTLTASPTQTLTPTSTNTPTFTPTLSLTPTHSPTPTQTYTQTATFTAGPSPTPFKAISSGNVWVRPIPIAGAQRIGILYINVPVSVLSVYGRWLEVEWQAGTSTQHGWVPAMWISLREPVPADRITLTPTPTKRP